MTSNYELIGNSWLRAKYELGDFPLTHISYIGPRPKKDISDDHIVEVYPKTYFSGGTVGHHLEFGLKYDDLRLDFLKRVFDRLRVSDLEAYILMKPRGSYQRRIGYLFELLTGKKLSLADTGRVNYLDLIDPDRYVTGNTVKHQRWAINDNLPGTADYCPVIRNTAALSEALSTNFAKEMDNVAGQFPGNVYRRAVNYLYTKETRSSYQIEHEDPSPDKMNRFIALLEKAGKDPVSTVMTEENLTQLQNQIIDPRYIDKGFRNDQNFVSQSTTDGTQLYHYICPPPQLVRSMMKGLSKLTTRIGEQHPIVQATMTAFGFVFIHPFNDGNGRIHRFLIHDVLTRNQLVKPGVVIPVSAHMLKNMDEYDQALEHYSKPLMKRIQYTEHPDRSVTVTNAKEIDGYFRYPDLTRQCIYLANTVRLTIREDIFQELDFMVRYDEARSALQNVVGLPDRRLNLFMQFLYQNNGQLPKRRRSEFVDLSDQEIGSMESIFQKIFAGSAAKKATTETTDDSAQKSNVAPRKKRSRRLGI